MILKNILHFSILSYFSILYLFLSYFILLVEATQVAESQANHVKPNQRRVHPLSSDRTHTWVGWVGWWRWNHPIHPWNLSPGGWNPNMPNEAVGATYLSRRTEQEGARLGRWLWGSAAPARAQIRFWRRFYLHRPGSHSPQCSLQLGSTATSKSDVAKWLGRVERVWALMGRWPHLPAHPLSPTPTSSPSSCNGGTAPPRPALGQGHNVGEQRRWASLRPSPRMWVPTTASSWWSPQWAPRPVAHGGAAGGEGRLPPTVHGPHLPSLVGGGAGAPWISSGGRGWGDPATTVATARALWPVTATGGRPRARRGEGRPLVARA
jgi:hypothetical protein